LTSPLTNTGILRMTIFERIPYLYPCDFVFTVIMSETHLKINVSSKKNSNVELTFLLCNPLLLIRAHVYICNEPWLADTLAPPISWSRFITYSTFRVRGTHYKTMELMDKHIQCGIFYLLTTILFFLNNMLNSVYIYIYIYIYIYTTVQKFGVTQTISCLPWKLTLLFIKWIEHFIENIVN